MVPKIHPFDKTPTTNVTHKFVPILFAMISGEVLHSYNFLVTLDTTLFALKASFVVYGEIDGQEWVFL